MLAKPGRACFRRVQTHRLDAGHVLQQGAGFQRGLFRTENLIALFGEKAVHAAMHPPNRLPLRRHKRKDPQKRRRHVKADRQGTRPAPILPVTAGRAEAFLTSDAVSLAAATRQHIQIRPALFQGVFQQRLAACREMRKRRRPQQANGPGPFVQDNQPHLSPRSRPRRLPPQW